VFTLTYDPDALESVDLVGATWEEESVAGLYGKVRIQSVGDGQIVFGLENPNAPDGTAFSGVVNLFRFEKCGNDETQCEISVAEASERGQRLIE
jgi:hypothetical protein